MLRIYPASLRAVRSHRRRDNTIPPWLRKHDLDMLGHPVGLEAREVIACNSDSYHMRRQILNGLHLHLPGRRSMAHAWCLFALLYLSTPGKVGRGTQGI